MAEYKVSSSEIMVMFGSLKTENTQENTQVKGLTDKEKKILDLCANPMSKRELAQHLGYKTIKSIKPEIERLLADKRLEMTIPDKPQSRNQKYIVKR